MSFAKVFLLFAAVLAIAVSAQIAAAANVGVYVEPHEEDPQAYCLEANEGANAFQVLQELDDAEFRVINGQHILCSVDDSTHFVCNPESDRSLRVVLQEDGKWLDDSIPSYDAGSKCYDSSFNALLNFVHYSFTTHTFSSTHYCARHGDVLGIIDEERPAHRPEAPRFSITPSYDELCEPVSIHEVKAYVDGAVQDVDEGGGKIKNVYPGSELKLRLGIKNIGPRKVEREIRDIAVTATIEDIDNGRDVKQKSQTFSLDSREIVEVTFTFAIPAIARERSYDLIVELEGEDKSGFSFEKETEFKVGVEREKSKLFIEDLSAPASSLCAGDSTTITARLRNIGSSRSAGVLSLRNAELGTAYSQQVELEQATNAASAEDMIIPITIPATASAKTYSIAAMLAYGGETSVQSLNLTVNDCKGTARFQALGSAGQSLKYQAPQMQGSVVSAPEVVASSSFEKLAPFLLFPLIALFAVYVFMLMLLEKPRLL